jgi:uncharacterized membrane protein
MEKEIYKLIGIIAIVRLSDLICFLLLCWPHYEITGNETTKYYCAGSQRIAIPKDIGTV